MARIRRFLENRSGQAGIEFLLVFILFVFLMYIIVEGSRMTFAYSSASQAAREAVRYASVRGSTSSCLTDCPATVTHITNYARGKAVGVHLKAVNVCWFKSNPTAVCGTNPHNPDNQEPGSNVRVAVTIDFQPLLPLVPAGIVAIASTSEMVISN